MLTDSRGPCCNDGIFKDVEFLANHIIGHHGERDLAPIFKHGLGPPLHCFQLDKDITIPTPTLHWPHLKAATYLKELRRHGRAAQKQASLPGESSRRNVLLVAAGQHHGRDEFVDCIARALEELERRGSLPAHSKSMEPKPVLGALLAAGLGET